MMRDCLCVAAVVAVIAFFAWVIHKGNQADERKAAEWQRQRDAAIASGDLRKVAPGIWAIRDRVNNAWCYVEQGAFVDSLRNCVGDAK